MAGFSGDQANADNRGLILGLENAWVQGRATIERPAHLFAGFGCETDFRAGAFSYSKSFLPPRVQEIGRYCSIAQGVEFGHAEHPARWLSTSSFTYDQHFMLGTEAGTTASSLFRSLPLSDEARHRRIVIENDVWIGLDAYIRGGITLSNGCIVGARAVVTRDVPPFAIVAGVPAKVIGYRFSPEIIAELQELAWWQYDFTQFEGVDVSDIAGAIERIRVLIGSGLTPYQPACLVLCSDLRVPAMECL